MEHKSYFLRQDAQIEPLFNGWYAWPSLIAPATAAMNIAYSHIKIMKSYIMAPAAHAAAIKNPAMRGGPFIDYDGKRVDEVKALLEKTLREQSHMIAFAEAVKSLNELLSKKATGYSVEGLYSAVPEALKGYVELTYNLNNHPLVRFIEPLLYDSPYYDPRLQSIGLSLIDKDDRSFAFSSPRLEDSRQLIVNSPFAGDQACELFRLKDNPKPLSYIKEVLDIGGRDEALLSSLLSETGPQSRPVYSGDGLRIRYFGHACLLVESGGVCLLTDPLISYLYEGQTPRYTYADLPDTIDYVLITHSHSDHLVLESLLQIRHKIKNVIVPRNSGGYLEDPSMRLVLEHLGFGSVIEIDEMQSVRIPGGAITSLPFLGEHADLNIRSKNAYLIKLNGSSILCAADSSNLEMALYKHIHKAVGDVDILFLGMECDGAPLSWMYGQLLTTKLARDCDQSRRLSGSDYEKAIGIVNELNPEQVFVYAMGQEPWLSYIAAVAYTEQSKPIVESDKLIAECRRRRISSERLNGFKEILQNGAARLRPAAQSEQ